MDIERLTHEMRCRAIRIEREDGLHQAEIEEAIEQEVKTETQVVYQPTEEQKKLYFNAGRWAGGSRDWNARKAFEQLNKMEA